MKAEYGRCRQQAAVLLQRFWDPVGVANLADAAGEYDAYAAAVSALILRGGSVEAVAAYLFSVETEQMGLAGDWPRCRDTAVRLVGALRDGV